MKSNVGTIDRALRIIAGLGIFAAGYYFKSWWGLVGIVPVLTGLVRYCPLYPAIGLNTCSKQD